jgi:hypothetical protein
MYEVIGYDKNIIPSRPQLQEPPMQGSYEVLGYAPKMPQGQQKESGLTPYLKDIPSIAVAGAAGAAGVPAGIESLFHNITKKPELPTPDYERLADLGVPQERLEKLKELQQVPEQRRLPSTEEIKSGIGKLVGERSVTPQTEAGKEIGEAAETIGSMLFPLPFLGATKLVKATKIAGAGQLAKFASKQIGLSEDAADKVKLGTMLFTGILGQNGPRKEAARIYKELEKQTANSFVPRDEVRKISDKIIQEFAQKGLAEAHPGKKALMEVADRLSLLGETGPKVSVSDIIDFKRDLADKAKELAKYGSRTQGMVKKLGADLNNLLKKSPSVPKDIADALSSADSLYSGSKNISKVFQTIRDLPTVGKIAAPTTLALLGFYSPEKALKLLPVGAALAGGGALYQIAKSPALQKHYASIISSAAKDLKGPTLKHIKKFDEELNKER